MYQCSNICLLGQKNQQQILEVFYVEIKYCPFFRHTSSAIAITPKVRLHSTPKYHHLSSLSPLKCLALFGVKSSLIRVPFENEASTPPPGLLSSMILNSMYRVHMVKQLIPLPIGMNASECRALRSWYPELREWQKDTDEKSGKSFQGQGGWSKQEQSASGLFVFIHNTLPVYMWKVQMFTEYWRIEHWRREHRVENSRLAVNMDLKDVGSTGLCDFSFLRKEEWLKTQSPFEIALPRITWKALMYHKQ